MQDRAGHFDLAKEVTPGQINQSSLGKVGVFGDVTGIVYSRRDDVVAFQNCKNLLARLGLNPL